VSCGPSYLVSLLAERGYGQVLGIDSDPAKVEHATRRGLDCQMEQAFSFVSARNEEFDVIVCVQELNHLMFEEMLEFLELSRRALRPGDLLFVYGLNGANPLVGAENLAHNIDHLHSTA